MWHKLFSLTTEPSLPEKLVTLTMISPATRVLPQAASPTWRGLTQPAETTCPKAAKRKRIRLHLPHRPDMDAELQNKIRSRRSHQKSRLGCRNCKKRRVKVSLLIPPSSSGLSFGVLPQELDTFLNIDQAPGQWREFCIFSVLRSVCLLVNMTWWKRMPTDMKLTYSSATRKNRFAPIARTIRLNATSHRLLRYFLTPLR